MHFFKLDLENPILNCPDNSLLLPPLSLTLNRHGSFLTPLLLLFHPALCNWHPAFLNIFILIVPLSTAQRPVSYRSWACELLLKRRWLIFDLHVLLCVEFLFWFLDLWLGAEKPVLLGVDRFAGFWRRKGMRWWLQLFHVFLLDFMDLVKFFHCLLKRKVALLFQHLIPDTQSISLWLLGLKTLPRSHIFLCCAHFLLGRQLMWKPVLVQVWHFYLFFRPIVVIVVLAVFERMKWKFLRNVRFVLSLVVAQLANVVFFVTLSREIYGLSLPARMIIISLGKLVVLRVLATKMFLLFR